MVATLVALLALMAGAPSAASKKPGLPALSPKATALLAGRINARLPEGMKLEARGQSIMAAPQANEDESRGVLDADGSRFVMMARELYMQRGADFRKAVDGVVRRDWGDRAGQCRVETLSVAAPAAAVGLSPPPPKETQEANLIYAAYASTPDGLVQLFTFYVNPSGWKDAESWAQLAREISLSLTAGTRVPALKAGERRLSMAPSKDLVISVPDNMALAVQQGPDFVVHRLRRVAVLGEPVANCGIYLGAHPATQRSQLEDEGPKIAPQGKKKGKVLGQDVEWDNWLRQEILASEVILPYPGGAGMFLHLFCFAPRPEDLEALRRMMEAARAG